MSTILDHQKRPFVVRSNRTIVDVRSGQQETSSAVHQSGNVSHQLALVDHMLDVFQANHHVKALAAFQPFVQPPNVENLEPGLRRATKRGSLRGHALIALTPAEAERGIPEECRADCEGPGAAADVEQMEPSVRGKPRAKPSPAGKKQRVSLEQSRGEAEQTYQA